MIISSIHIYALSFVIIFSVLDNATHPWLLATCAGQTVLKFLGRRKLPTSYPWPRKMSFPMQVRESGWTWVVAGSQYIYIIYKVYWLIVTVYKNPITSNNHHVECADGPWNLFNPHWLQEILISGHIDSLFIHPGARSLSDVQESAQFLAGEDMPTNLLKCLMNKSKVQDDAQCLVLNLTTYDAWLEIVCKRLSSEGPVKFKTLSMSKSLSTSQYVEKVLAMKLMEDR